MGWSSFRGSLSIHITRVMTFNFNKFTMKFWGGSLHFIAANANTTITVPKHRTIPNYHHYKYSTTTIYYTGGSFPFYTTRVKHFNFSEYAEKFPGRTLQVYTTTFTNTVHTHQQPITYSTAHIYCYVLPHLLIFAIIFARAAPPQASTDTRLHPAIFSTQVHSTIGAVGEV